MGLTITNPTRVLGLDIPGLYLRFKIDQYFSGVLDVYINVYASKEAYQENINNHFQIEGIKRHYQFAHDRELNGADILQFVHDSIIADLTTDETQEIEAKDTEGKIITDKDGKAEKITVVTKEKFIDPTKISSDLKPTK